MAFLVASGAPRAAPTTGLSPHLARALLVVALVAGVVAAGLIGQSGAPDAIRAAGDDLTKLLRMMALLKAGMAAALVAGVFWRLGAPVGALRLAAYGAACAAMAGGPMLIWSMAHVGLGAALLHAGLLATVLLLWRDPAVGAKLSSAVARRRRRS